MSAAFDFGLATPINDELTNLRTRIAASYRADEAEIVRLRIDEARLSPDELAPTQAIASRLAEAVRTERAKSGWRSKYAKTCPQLTAVGSELTKAGFTTVLLTAQA